MAPLAAPPAAAVVLPAPSNARYDDKRRASEAVPVVLTRARRFAVGLVLLLAGLSGAPSPAEAAPTAARRLVDTYAPVVMLRAQENAPCDTSEEQYAPPTSVGAVLGNPRVRLLIHNAQGTRVVKRAPTAADIAGRGEDAYLDLPGSPLRGGCKYARDFAELKRAGRAPAVTYAHIAREPGQSGFAVQYWFFYYFNQFNDLHESDWEGMQLRFPARNAAQALAAGPSQIVLFQHAGGERADWDDAKVQKRGTHPVVYSAAGSHATYYDSALYLGNGQNGSGVGCDNTTEPLITVRPRPVLVPDTPTAGGAFRWLTYTGHWGQREASYNNGPTGPNTKTVWSEPFSWMDGTRTSSPTVPGGSLIGPSVAGAFCGTVAQISTFMNLATDTPPGAIAVALVCLLLIVVPARLTTWRPVDLRPLRQARALGQLLLAAGRLYRRHWQALVLIGLAALLVIGAVDGLLSLVLPAVGANGSGQGSSGSGITITFTGGIGRPVASPLASAAVIAVVRNLERDQPAGFGAAWRAVLGRFWRLLVAPFIATVLVVLLALTIIGIPFAIRKLVHWQFVQQEILFEDRSIREAFRGSTRVVRGHWWHTAAVSATFWILSQIPGPLLGFALLFTTVPITQVNLLGSLVFALIVPYVAAGRTLLYLDLAARKATESARVVPTPAPAPAS
jgi:hypothetical protein